MGIPRPDSTQTHAARSTAPGLQTIVKNTLVNNRAFASLTLSKMTDSLTQQSLPSQDAHTSTSLSAVSLASPFENSAANLTQCSICLVNEVNLLQCNTCEKYFHRRCAYVSTDNLLVNWNCLVCSLSAKYTFKAAYDYVFEIRETTLAPVIAFLVKSTEQASTLAMAVDAPMADPELPVDKPRKVVIFGNDIKGVRQSLNEFLPKDAKTIFIPFACASSTVILTEAKHVVENHARTHKLSMIFHPGVQDCLQLEGQQLVEDITKFSRWLTEFDQDSELSVVSVPQVVRGECKSVNDALMKLDEERLLKYIPLTMHQSELVRRELKQYDKEISSRVANVLGSHSARFLGVPLPRKIKPKKDDHPRTGGTAPSKPTQRVPTPRVSIPRVPNPRVRRTQITQENMLRTPQRSRKSPPKERSQTSNTRTGGYQKNPRLPCLVDVVVQALQDWEQTQGRRRVH